MTSSLVSERTDDQNSIIFLKRAFQASCFEVSIVKIGLQTSTIKNDQNEKLTRYQNTSLYIPKYVFIYIIFVSEPNWMINNSKWSVSGNVFQEKEVVI